MLDTAEKLAIHELLSRAAYGLDEHNLDLIEPCFAPDATMIVRIAGGPTVGPFDGREAIMKLMADSIAGQTDRRRHLVTNILFESEQANSAQLKSNLTLFSIENGEMKPLTAGVYSDKVVKVDGAWLIAARDLALDLPY